MARTKKAKPATATLEEIAAAGIGGLWTTIDSKHDYVQNGFVELNPNGPNDAGETLVRITQAGLKLINQPQPQPEKETTKMTTEYTIESNVAIPPIAGRGRRGSSYPFDALEKGQSFAVDKEAKTMASTVAAANAKYAEEVPGQTRVNRKGNVVPATKQVRQFILRSVEGGGCRVWRVL